VRLFSAAVAICVLAGASLQSASAQPEATFIGWGDTSCLKWTAERRDPSSFLVPQMHNWAAGFVSGSNWSSAGPDLLASVDIDAIGSWLDNYCLSNPLELFPNAVIALARELAQRANR
jgi:ABC-type phosphate transport system substrate-binding protein